MISDKQLTDRKKESRCPPKRPVPNQSVNEEHGQNQIITCSYWKKEEKKEQAVRTRIKTVFSIDVVFPSLIILVATPQTYSIRAILAPSNPSEVRSMHSY